MLRLDANSLGLTIKYRRLLHFGVAVACTAFMFLAYLRLIPTILLDFGSDWTHSFLPAFDALLRGQNPYSIGAGFFNPPWLLVLMAPFAIWGKGASLALYFVFTAVSLVVVARKLGARSIALMAFLLSPPVIQSLYLLNVDIFVLWGFVLPPPVALLLILVKPQVGFIFAGFLLFEEWRQGGIPRVVAVALPAIIALSASFLLFGNWLSMEFPGRANGSIPQGSLMAQAWNTSLLPYGLLIGVPIAIYAFVRRNQHAAIAASPFFAPYIAPPSWVALLAGCLRSDILTVLAVAALYFMNRYGSLVGIVRYTWP